MGGLEIEWVEPAEISLWMASRFINQSDRVGMFQQDRTHIEQIWTGQDWFILNHMIPCLIRLWKLVVCNNRDSFRFTFSKVYIIEPPSIAKLWTFWSAIPNFSQVIWCLGCSKDSLDPKLGHGLSRLCWSLGDAAEPPKYPVWISLRQVAYGTYSV